MELIMKCEIRGSQGDEAVNVGLIDSNAIWDYRWISLFRRNILPPSSGLESFCPG
jgi:hypothetical protein